MGRSHGGVKEPAKTPQQLMREQMDELMGKTRDVPLNERDTRPPSFADPDVDKFYLCGCSPYELLKGTKSESLPQMERDGFLQQRSEALRTAWMELPQEEKDKYGYERQLLDFLQALVEEQDRRIAKTKDRYDRENEALPAIPPETAAQLYALKEEIRALLAQSEALGEQGDVDASMMVFNRANALQMQMQEVERKATPPHKKQFVDDISGLVYASTDNEARLDDLRSGKLYKGWKAIRDKLAELREQNPPAAGGAGSSSGKGRVEEDRRRSTDRRFDDRRPDDRRGDDRRNDRWALWSSGRGGVGHGRGGAVQAARLQLAGRRGCAPPILTLFPSAHIPFSHPLPTPPPFSTTISSAHHRFLHQPTPPLSPCPSQEVR
jgi:hypothetical protein